MEVKRQALIDQEIADLERVGAHQQAELAKRREDVLFSERLGELGALISELEAEMSFMQGQHDALYCSEEAVEIDCDVKRGEFLTASTAYDETMRLKKEVARLRHAQKKRGYYGVNDQGWFVACGNTQPEKEKQVRLDTHNKFDVLKCQPFPNSDNEADVPKKKEEKRRRRTRRKPKEVDNFDELLAEAAKWDAECKKQGAPPRPSKAAYEALAQKRVRSFGTRSREPIGKTKSTFGVSRTTKILRRPANPVQEETSGVLGRTTSKFICELGQRMTTRPANDGGD
ncbi:hypothetical protein FJT64_020370 [Amphibalanus amphitrite]|uniref:Uncharacterized protein n=1 Tax=Amphibalanus amphitrite TaxID=1232801 RepID=A0A6A4WXI7_AMPAM|nr:hypothetical protein FJT64_020370 [Amphibalanus amphitrite]